MEVQENEESIGEQKEYRGMMRTKFFIGSLIIFGLIVLCFSMTVQGSISIDEQQSSYFGNQFDAFSYATNVVTPYADQGVFFRTNTSMNVDTIYYNCNSVAGAWAGKTLRFGIREVSSNGTPKSVWAGPTNMAYGDKLPAAGVLTITLLETVALADNTVYFLCINDSGKYLNAVLYMTNIIATTDIASVKSRPVLGFLEPYDMYGLRTSLTWTRTNTMFGWIVADTTGFGGTVKGIGNGYSGAVAYNVYMNNGLKQMFNVSSNVIVDGLDICVKQLAATYSANASLFYDLCYASNDTLIRHCVVDRNATLKVLANGPCRWVKTVFSNFTLRAGVPYYIKVWSKTASTKAYVIPQLNSVTGNALFNRLTYGGTRSCLNTTSNNGTSWTAYPGSDIPFRFHKSNQNYYSDIVLYENIVGASGTHQYQFKPSLGVNGRFWVWANYTGTATGGSGGANLSVINPNPGNGTCMGYNFLQANPLGTKTCVDVSYKNFSDVRLYENNSIVKTDGTTDIGGLTIYSQSFRSNNSFILKGVKVRLSANSFTGLAVIGIRNVDSNGKPTGNDLVNTTYDVTTLGVGGQWIFVNFSKAIGLNKNVNYRIVVYPYHFLVSTVFRLRFNASYDSDYVPPVDVDDQYMRGNMSFSNNGGATWTFFDYDFEGLEGASGDFYFGTYGVDSWSNVVNLTWLSNSSSVWHPYAFTSVVQNGSVCVLNTNMTVNDTQYWWKVNHTTNASGESGYNVYTFTTADRKQIIPIGSSGGGLAMSISLGGGVGILGGLCVGMVFVRRRRRQTS